MTRYSATRSTLALAFLPLVLSGCYLYFEDDSRNRDDWRFDQEPGDSCTSDDECAPGCFCSGASICEESASCETRETCADGFTCDERSTCAPDPNAEPTLCSADTTCATGWYCDSALGECVASTVCTAEGTCTGDLVCDPDRNTCIVATVTCQSTVDCSTAPPICPAGSTPAIENGCYVGTCMAKSECPDGAPFACSDLNSDESACVNSATCSPVYAGRNCTNPNGDQCTSGAANCTCESFVYDYCKDA